MRKARTAQPPPPGGMGWPPTPTPGSIGSAGRNTVVQKGTFLSVPPSVGAAADSASDATAAAPPPPPALLQPPPLPPLRERSAAALPPGGPPSPPPSGAARSRDRQRRLRGSTAGWLTD
ncbi:hypothetical protein PLESTF_001657600 [Pleodorina starrii]|nr:hypothetical protein PLESTM_001622100 [Pleodorina starrii]GLC75564.1 hypothetical protein PLESTF_001657600 [Pleodorina starrii]